MENLANTKSWVTKNLATMESRITENLADMESRVTESLANTENQVMQDSGGGGYGTRRRKTFCSKQKGSCTVVAKRYYQDTKMQIAKDVSKRIGREERRGRAGLLV
jgi:hypothetical protein